MNRPPTIFDNIFADDVFDNQSYLFEQCDEIQEALTVEWLIEQGLMPDPTDFCKLENYLGPYWVCYIDETWEQGFKDCDPDGKPSDYEVQK